MHAVLTCDIVHSTSLHKEQNKQLMKSLSELLKSFKYEFYRGDSFQVYVKDPGKALEAAVSCRAAAIRLAGEESTVIPDIRISIALGEVEEPVTALATARGEAFVLSGRAFDEMAKTQKRMVINVRHPMASVALSVIADYLDATLGQLTAKQAEVIVELLSGQTQQQVAEKLGRSKSTISQHVTAGRWDAIEKVLKQYRQIIELIPNDSRRDLAG